MSDFKSVSVKLDPMELLMLLDALGTLDEYLKSHEQMDVEQLTIKLSIAFVRAVRQNKETWVND